MSDKPVQLEVDKTQKPNKQFDLYNFNSEFTNIKDTEQPTDIIESIRHKYKARTGKDIDRSRIIFKGQTLFDHNTLGQHGVGNGDLLHIVLFLNGKI